MKDLFSFKRLIAIIVKEFTQMRRDRLTFAMLVGIPLMQLLLFGYAINSNPKNLPTDIVSHDHSAYTRTFISALQNTGYFNVIKSNTSDQEAEYDIATGQAQFTLNIPADFTRDLIKGKRPSLLLTVDATDPMSGAYAISALSNLSQRVFTRQLAQDGLSKLVQTASPFKLISHAKYNPENITQYNIVPGLMGVVLTMTMVMITGLAITRERERGTMESLLSTPARPIEVMLGKILPYVIMGYIQQFIILILAVGVFNIPEAGSYPLLILLTLPFICANLAVGLTFSTIAKNQLQSMQMTFFFFLPSILLSGFMFPFYGMPTWAQWIGECLPLTHFLRIIRGIMIKGNEFYVLWPDVWPILVFTLIVMLVGLKRYRQTLD